MKYDHIVKKNGKYYQPGEDVPDGASAKSKNVEPEYSDKDIEFETDAVSKKEYTKTDIKKMSTEELQSLASENGIEDAYEMTGSALKQVLIDKFNL